MKTSFQHRVGIWLRRCFAQEVCEDRIERCDRYLEESLELLQSQGYPKERIAALVDYVYGRPVGEPSQEVGGTMVTLAALCEIAQLDLSQSAEKELSRIQSPEVMAKIQAKQKAKSSIRFDTPLPGKID